MNDQHRGMLMSQHTAARARRDTAPLDSVRYREASEDVARIEIAIAAAEEPPPILSAASAGTAADPSAGTGTSPERPAR